MWQGHQENKNTPTLDHMCCLKDPKSCLQSLVSFVSFAAWHRAACGLSGGDYSESPGKVEGTPGLPLSPARTTSHG